MSHHLDALLLALASSTDNFTVGLSVGISQKSLPLWANGFISLCNAGGAWMAGHGGVWFSRAVTSTPTATTVDGNSSDVGASLPHTLPLYLSGLAFGVLAFSEWKNYREEISTSIAKGKNDDDSTSERYGGPNHETSPKSMSTFCSVLQLAVPMTLNNLAGGVAGGAAGLTPELSAMYALSASFATMLVGYMIGIRLGAAMKDQNKMGKPNQSGSLNWRNPSLLSACLLGLLCILTLREAISG